MGGTQILSYAAYSAERGYNGKTKVSGHSYDASEHIDYLKIHKFTVFYNVSIFTMFFFTNIDKAVNLDQFKNPT